MLSLFFTDTNAILNLIAALATAILANIGVFSFLRKPLKKAILTNDVDGFHITIGGAVLLVLGLIIPDYTFAFVLTALGLALASVGGLIWLRDDFTWQVLHPGVGFAYLALMVLVNVVVSSHGLGYDFRGLFTDVLPVAVIATLVTLSFVAMTSATFKKRLLPVRKEGRTLIWFAVAAIVFAPLAVLNPAVMTVLGALAGIWLALGISILIERPERFHLLYSKLNVTLYLAAALGLVITLRLWF